MSLPELPKQPPGVAWPTQSWPRASAPNSLNLKNCDEIFDLTETQGVAYAFLVVKKGELLYERYANGANAFYLQYSWSMAKSITHALAGILVRQNRLDIHAPVAIAEWADDSRRDITFDQLLRMSSGLAFNEDYVDGQSSDVIHMLQFEGRHDMGSFAAAKPLVHAPDECWSYSSGTTNIICRILRDIIGDGMNGMSRFMADELFEPLGMRSATPKFDHAGTFIGSSFLFATPQDFARFGLLYLRGGEWDGRQIVSPEWVDYARTPTFNDGEDCYGAHWWMKPDNPDWFYCSGYDGQRIICVPEKDVVIVRLGRTPVDEAGYVWDRVYQIAESL